MLSGGQTHRLAVMAQPIPILIGIEWRDPGHEPTLQGDWPRNGVLPQADEVRWTISVFHLSLQVGDRVWFMFEPDAAVFNGLSEEPAHMDRAAVVEVEILQRQLVSTQIYSNQRSPLDRDWSWIQVRCLRVIPLWDIPNHFEETPPYYFEVRDDLPHFDLLPVKGAEANKIVEFVARSQEYSDAYHLTKTTPPRAVLRLIYCAGYGEHVIVNSAFQLPNTKLNIDASA
jgi:hypothetical protein